MAKKARSKAGKATQAEQLTKEELKDLNQKSIQKEIEEEMKIDTKAEEELEQHEIEIDILEVLGAGRGGRRRTRSAVLGTLVMRQLVRALLLYTRAVVNRMRRSTTLKKKLAAASRRGPRAVRALVGLAVLRAMPSPFRRASRRLVAIVIGLSFRAIARKAGLKAREIDCAELRSHHG